MKKEICYEARISAGNWRDSSYQSCTISPSGWYSWTTCENFSYPTREEAESAISNADRYAHEHGWIHEVEYDAEEDND